MRPKIKLFLALGIVVLGLILLFRGMGGQSDKKPKVAGKSAEIQAILATNSLKEQSNQYRALLSRIGPETAQEALYTSGLSFDGQTHLLNHTVGDWLYDQYKAKGLTFCKDYFLSSCYHGFVIKAVAKEGIGVLKDVMKTCNQKGWHVSVQCSHAIGHGMLAWVGYANLPVALKKCDEVGKMVSDFPLYNCHDGAFMENIWAVHEDGKPSKDRWVSDIDPLYPCNDLQIAEEYRNACWSNQPMRMYQMFQGDVTKVGKECAKLSIETYKATCFDAIARQIHPMIQGNMDRVFVNCSKMPEEWIQPCIDSIVRAEYSVGGRELPYMICASVEKKDQESCWKSLSGIISVYTVKSTSERRISCDSIVDAKWREKCLQL